MASISIAGREYALRYTLAALRQFKTAYGKPLVECQFVPSGRRLPEIVDTVCMTYAVWAGLTHVDPKLTFPQVEELLGKYLDDGGKLKAIYDALGEAFQESGIFASGDEDKESGSPLAKAGEVSKT